MIYAWYNMNMYGIQFSYTRDGFGHRMDTGCAIFDLGDDPEDETLRCIAAGSALLHPGDNFRAETGRKMALERALNQMSASKEFRTAIWAAYFRRVTSLEDRQKDNYGRTFGCGC